MQAFHHDRLLDAHAEEATDDAISQAKDAGDVETLAMLDVIHAFTQGYQLGRSGSELLAPPRVCLSVDFVHRLEERYA